MKIVVVAISIISLFLFLNLDDNASPVLNTERPNNSIYLSFDAGSPAKIIYHYEDDFSNEEKKKLEKWLNITAIATQDRLGNYPFDLHFFLNRSDGSKEPVPWAHTERSNIQGVHFHVDTDYSIEDFLSDWTAPHEICHLAIPFVGKTNSWFSEGFATYMQNEVLLEMNEYSPEEIKKKINRKLENARPHYEKDESFVDVAKGLRKTHNYPEMYWGGAYFFIELNERIMEIDGRTLCEVLKEYSPCCRLNDESLQSFLNSIDGLIEGDPANDLMKKYTTVPAREILK